MFAQSPTEFGRPIPCGCVGVGNSVWAVQLLGAMRGPGEWRLRLRVVGAESHEISVRVPADSNHTITAERVMNAVRRWLAACDGSPATHLDLVE